MSAFAVIYERNNTPVSTGVLLRVMDRLKHRGPDGSDILAKEHVALGHWHFWTTPEDIGEKQPLSLEGLPFIIVLDGRIDNRSDLISELKLPPSLNSRISDAALILYAYDRWSERCFEHFVGEFAVVIFDETRNELVCARDPLGDRTMFYSVEKSRVVIASEPWAIMGAKETGVRLHDGAVAHFFADKNTPDGQTLFEDVFEFLPGHYFIVSGAGVRKTKYWQPRQPVRLRNQTNEEYAEQFLYLLEQSV